MNITAYQADTWHQLSEDERLAFQEWLKHHGIEPRTLHVSEPVTIKDDVIHYSAMTYESASSLQVKGILNKQGEVRAIAEERTTPMLTPPPGSTFGS